jgi:hypothetical protein
MRRFFFHQYINGRRLTEDRRGHLFGDAAEACTYALCRAPRLLDKILRTTAKNTYLSTEVRDGKRTLFIIRGKVTTEKV